MSREIAVICYDTRNAEKVNLVMQRCGYSYPVYVCEPEECGEKGLLAERQGARAIISFGMFAKAIRRYVKIPVVTIDVTYENIAHALIKASHLGNRVAIVGFKQVLEKVMPLRELLKIELIQYPVISPEEMPQTMEQMRRDRIEVVVGGAYQISVARQKGLKTALIETQESDIENALRNARAFLNRSAAPDSLSDSMDYFPFGTISVDDNGRVVIMNREASDILGVSQKNASEFNINDISSQMMADIRKAIYEGEETVNRVIKLKERMVLYHVSPMRDERQICGAVITIQDAHDLQEAETSIRRKIVSKENRAVYTFDDIIGESTALAQTVKVAFRYASAEQTVLITGESGTGKEMFAQSIHMASKRKKAPFVAINCAALPENILESELFGYVKGAFTGALREGKRGLFETAHSGTIFLDEIGEISLSMQGKLLRVLQERTIRRLGDDKVIPVDIRVIAATNKDLVRLVREGSFREDLYFRINVLCLQLPALRERERDILLLAEDFLQQESIRRKRHFCLSEGARRRMLAYPWPGNIRELQNMISRVTIISDEEEISEELVTDYMKENSRLYLPPTGSGDEQPSPEESPEEVLSVEEALRRADGNRTEAARLLGVSRATLYRHMKTSQTN